MALKPDSSEAFEQHAWEVHGFPAYRLGSRGEAEDLTQETFERAFRAWGRFDPARASVRTWLLAIARNLLIDHYRSRGTRKEVPLAEDADYRPLSARARAPVPPRAGPTNEAAESS